MTANSFLNISLKCEDILVFASTTRLFKNWPFYRYRDHIELIRFKEYYRMPRGHEHISFVFLSAFRNIFS